MAILVNFPYQVKNKNDVINFFVEHGFELSEEIVYLYVFEDKNIKICHLDLDEQEQKTLISYFNKQECYYPKTSFQIEPEKFYPQVFINFLPENIKKEEIETRLNKYGKIIKFEDKNGEVIVKSKNGNYYVNFRVESEEVAENILNNLRGKKWFNDSPRKLDVQYKTLSDYLSEFQLLTEEKEDFLQQENYILISETLREFVTFLCNEIDTQRK